MFGRRRQGTGRSIAQPARLASSDRGWRSGARGDSAAPRTTETSPSTRGSHDARAAGRGWVGSRRLSATNGASTAGARSRNDRVGGGARTGSARLARSRPATRAAGILGGRHYSITRRSVLGSAATVSAIAETTSTGRPDRLGETIDRTWTMACRRGRGRDRGTDDAARWNRSRPIAEICEARGI